MKSEKPEIEITIRKAGYQEYIAIIFVKDVEISDSRPVEVWRTPNYCRTAREAFDDAITKMSVKCYTW